MRFFSKKTELQNLVESIDLPFISRVFDEQEDETRISITTVYLALYASNDLLNSIRSEKHVKSFLRDVSFDVLIKECLAFSYVFLFDSLKNDDDEETRDAPYDSVIYAGELIESHSQLVDVAEFIFSRLGAIQPQVATESFLHNVIRLGDPKRLGDDSNNGWPLRSELALAGVVTVCARTILPATGTVMRNLIDKHLGNI